MGGFFLYRLYFLLFGTLKLNRSANGLRKTAKNLFGNYVGSQLLFSDLVSNACSTNKWTLQAGCYQTVALQGLRAILLVLHSYILLNGQRERFTVDTVLKCSRAAVAGNRPLRTNQANFIEYSTSHRREHVSVQGSLVDEASHWPTDWLTGWLTGWMFMTVWVSDEVTSCVSETNWPSGWPVQ
jgi:hypothetical protein